MEVTVMWADGNELPVAEDHIWSEREPIRETFTDVENVRVHREYDKRAWEERYPEIVLIHEDGSTNRSRGRIVDADGEFGRVTTTDFDQSWNKIKTTHYDQVVGAWWESTSQWSHTIDGTLNNPRENRLYIVYKHEDHGFYVLGGYKPDHAHIRLPNGEVYTRGTSPVHDIDRTVSETGDTLTVTVKTDSDSSMTRVVDDVVSVQETTWGAGREYLVQKSDGTTVRADDVVNVDGPRYAIVRSRIQNGVPVVETYLDCLGVSSPEEGTIHRVYVSSSESMRESASVSRWQVDADVRVVNPDGTHGTVPGYTS